VKGGSERGWRGDEGEAEGRRGGVVKGRRGGVEGEEIMEGG